MPLRADGDVSRLRHWAKDRTAWSGAAAASTSPADTPVLTPFLILSTRSTKLLDCGKICLRCRMAARRRRRASLETSYLSRAAIPSFVPLRFLRRCRYITPSPGRGGLLRRLQTLGLRRAASSLTGDYLFLVVELVWCTTPSPRRGLMSRSRGEPVLALPAHMKDGLLLSLGTGPRSREPPTAPGPRTKSPTARVVMQSGPSSSARLYVCKNNESLGFRRGRVRDRAERLRRVPRPARGLLIHVVRVDVEARFSRTSPHEAPTR